jgi:hypothetical protein
MTTKTKLIIGASVIALVGGYFIYKALRPKKPMLNGTKDDTKSTTTTTTPSTTTTTNSTECKKYKVVNVTTWLNIRKSPSVSSTKQGSIPNAFPISAKPSNTEGWMELCEDGGGFVSSKYLKEVI